MDSTFKCCKKKECTNVCCIQCLGILHQSCMERKKNIQLVEGHKIICSKECATRKKNEDDAIQKTGEKVEFLIKALREKESQLEITERQRDDLTKELLEEIAELKKDNREREEFIKKLRRTSMDFEDEVVGAEQNYIRKLDEQKGIISEQKNDINNLIKKNTVLQEEIEVIIIDLNRYQKDIADLRALNKNMVTSFETMTQEKEIYIEELKKLKCDYISLKQDHSKLAEKRYSPSKQLSLDLNLVEKKTCEIKGNIYPKTSSQTDTSKNSILFVSGYHGRGMIDHLAQIREYSVQSIRKPGASDEELVHTAIANSRDFSKNDVIVIWLNKTNARILDTFVEETQHTQSLIISEPYRYDISINQRIYRNNLNFHKNLHLLNSDNVTFLECNNFIRRSNYTRDGFGLKTIVARYLSREIMKIIIESGHRKKRVENLGKTDVLQDNQDNPKTFLGAQEATCSFLVKEITNTTLPPEDSTRQKRME